MNEHPRLYAMLGVPATATPAEITHAFRAKLRSLHPDTRSAVADDAELRHLLTAYAVLRDPVRRAEYDRRTDGAAGSSRPEGGSSPASHHAKPARPVDISVNDSSRRKPTPPEQPPLRVGPVRWHH